MGYIINPVLTQINSSKILVSTLQLNHFNFSQQSDIQIFNQFFAFFENLLLKRICTILHYCNDIQGQISRFNLQTDFFLQIIKEKHA